MKILYYDCFSGISGDMNLAAMLDLGIGEDYLISELEKLNIHEYKIDAKKDSRNGITGTRVDVILKENADVHDHNCHHHNHRNLKDIEHIINESSLNDNVKKISIGIFNKVAQAEAKVHNKDIYEIHFHEVGAVDSIVDIVGAAICLDYLKPDIILSSPVETGSGFVKCAHGILPVPAPATAEILKNIPVRCKGVPFEATTPTGAAILASTVSEFCDDKDFSVKGIGYGIGHSDQGDIPDILRVFLGERKNDTLSEKAFVIECNIDDMNPEHYDYIMEKLFKIGCMDVYLTPIIMKKGRPAVKFSVLLDSKIVSQAEELILKETTSLGIRKYEVEKVMLGKEISVLKTAYGDIKVKSALLNGEKIKWKAEYEDCKRIANEKNIPIQDVYREVERCVFNMNQDI